MGTTLDELAKTLSPADLVRALRGQPPTPGRTYDPEAVKARLQQLDEATPTPLEERVCAVNCVQLLRITIPEMNLTYVTLAIDGRAQFTHDSEGKLDLSHTLESEDALLRKLVEAGMTSDTVVYKKKGNPGNPHPQKNPRPGIRPTLAYDPVIERYLASAAETHIVDVLDSPSKDDRPVIIRKTGDLERLLDPSFLHKALERGYEITIQDMDNYVSSSRRKIRHQRRIYVSEFLSIPEVTRLVSSFIRDHEIRPLVDSEHPDNHTGDAYDVARYIYRWFDGRKTSEITTQHFVDGLRYTYLEGLVHSVPKEEYELIRDNTAKWLAYAKSADHVRSNPDVQNRILPLVQNRKEDQKEYDINFEVARQLCLIVFDKSNFHNLKYFKMVIQGLWMFGYMNRQNQVEERGKERSARGVNVEYNDPMSHLVTRHEIYHPLLSHSLDEIKAEGGFSAGLTLEVRRDYQNLGLRLYRQVPEEQRRRVFTNMIFPDQPLAPEGEHLQRILTLYVGLHREDFLKRVS
jgi:hypothetical protein